MGNPYTKISSYLYYGAAGDDKPTGVPLPTICYETDTQKVYITRNGDTWIEASANILGGIPFLPDYTQLDDIVVTEADSTDNVSIRDVIGNKDDTEGGSIVALLKQIIAKLNTE